MDRLEPCFVSLLPDQLDNGKLYVSVEFASVIHLCCCGCGRQVVTPLSPTGWNLWFDGDSISLAPSIGNWNFPCESHYVITENRVMWDEHWSETRGSTKRKFAPNRCKWKSAPAVLNSTQTEDLDKAKRKEPVIEKNPTTLRKISRWLGL
jgi:Family of unknown function (DUF6527)